MKLSYDPRYNIAYLRLKEKSGDIETIRVTDGLNIDMTPDGTIYGFEFLNARQQLFQTDGTLRFVDEALGRSLDVPLIA